MNACGARSMAPSAMNVNVTSSMRKRRTAACLFSCPVDSMPMIAKLRVGRRWRRFDRSRVVIEHPELLELAVSYDPMLGDPDFGAQRGAGAHECCNPVTVGRDAL